jgi:hypothetical protein
VDKTVDPFEECNKDLVLIEAFVLQGKKFVRLPNAELVHFYLEHSYVFLCRYRLPISEEEAVLPVQANDNNMQAQVSAVDELYLINSRLKTTKNVHAFRRLTIFWAANFDNWQTFRNID